MENNNNKSQAEIYREERKARLQKAAEKNAKKSPKLSKTKKVVGKVIAIVLAVVIALGAVGGILNFFGAPQKIIKISADKDIKFTLAEFNYYYFSTWSNFQQTAYQYDSYYGQGAGLQYLGYDYSKSPDKQSYTDDSAAITGIAVADLGVTDPTWADVFKYAAINQLVQIKFGAMKAKETGITVTEEQNTELEDGIKALRENADKADFSLSRYLRASIGNGMSEKLYRQIMTENYLSTSYYTKYQEDTAAAVTEEQINARYDANRKSYDLVTVRLYELDTETPEYAEGATEDEKAKALQKAQDAVRAKADAFLAAATDEEKFIAQAKAAILTEDEKSTTNPDTATLYADSTYATFSAKSEELAEWIFSADRKVGDKTVVEVSDGVYDVVMLTVLPHKDLSPVSNNVRHILVKFPTDDDGKTVELKDEQKTEYKAKAQAILDEYLKNPTEDNFAALAKEKSEDTGSAENGGLIEGISPGDSYVANFLNWSTDSARKPGETAIVETEYGYHVMYYIGFDGYSWSEAAKNDLLNEQSEKYFTEEIDARAKKVSLNNAFINWTAKSELKLIKNIILNNY